MRDPAVRCIVVDLVGSAWSGGRTGSCNDQVQPYEETILTEVLCVNSRTRVAFSWGSKSDEHLALSLTVDFKT